MCTSHDAVSLFCCLPFGRERVVSVRILLPYFSVSSMNQPFGSLINGNSSGYLCGFLLCTSSYGSSAVSCSLYLPAALWVWRHVLILTCHLLWLPFLFWRPAGKRFFPTARYDILLLPEVPPQELPFLSSGMLAPSLLEMHRWRC